MDNLNSTTQYVSGMANLKTRDTIATILSYLPQLLTSIVIDQASF